MGGFQYWDWFRGVESRMVWFGKMRGEGGEDNGEGGDRMIEMNGSLNSARFCYIAKYASSSLQYWGLTVGIDELTGRNRNGEDQEGKRVRF